MTIRRFFVEEIKRPADGSCVISGSEARHIIKVLRMGKGDSFILMDRTGDRYEAVIDGVDGSAVLVKLTEKLPGQDLPGLEITLCQAMLKSGPMDYMIEKTSELGVTRIIPFTSERTVVKVDGDGASKKLRRWREIAVSAAKQSDRVVPAEICPPVSFAEATQQSQNSGILKVVLWEEEDSKGLKEVLRASTPCSHIIGMVGPEGGFSSGEIDAARQAGFISVSLGRRTLRAETAAMALVAIAQYEWGDLNLDGGR
jgi:16S rRNA (uracil1498-N3)-methyltransferase